MSSECYRALSRIRGLRHSVAGPKLVIREAADIIVARAGDAPLAWKRRHGPKGNDENRPWRPIRPALDGLLAPPAELRRAFREYLATKRPGIGTSEYHGRPQHDPALRLNLSTPNHPARIVRKILRSRGLGHQQVSPFLGREPENESDADVNPEHEALWHSLLPQFRSEPSDHALRMARKEKNTRSLQKLLKARRHLDLATAWLDAFPSEALEFLHRSGFVERRWHVLNLWIRAPGLRELMLDNPPLAWIAASSWRFRPPVTQPLRSLRALAHKPRKRLIEWLGICGGDGTLRLIRRLQCSDLTGEFSQPLADVLKNREAIRTMQNLPGGPISPLVVRILASDEPVSFPILAAINEGRRIVGSSMSVSRCLQDTRQMIRDLDDAEALRRLTSITSVARLAELHERLVERINVRPAWRSHVAREWTGSIPSPLAPLPSWLIPLDTLRAVEAEGRTMRHCAGMMARWVPNGDFYLYHVAHPAGVATLAIRKSSSPNPIWFVEQLAGRANSMVKNEIHEAIREWLDEVQNPDPF